MRTRLAILFIILILSAQYAKQLSYVGCKLFVPANATCDCQTILIEKKHGNEYAPTQHKHIHIDDFIQQNEMAPSDYFHYSKSTNKYPSFKSKVFITHLNEVFHPPAVI